MPDDSPVSRERFIVSVRVSSMVCLSEHYHTSPRQQVPDIERNVDNLQK